ncbi:MAG: CHAD domain-containing protein [Geminicoccaceae bacterium]
MSSNVARERELKLVGEPEVLRKLVDHVPGRAKVEAPTVVERLVSDYYDTSDLRLARRRLALRVRHDGRRRVQTLKAAALPGSIVADRPEWEVEIARDRPDLAAFASPEVVDETGLILPHDLRKQFSVDVERARTRLAWAGMDGSTSRIEVAVDHGRVVAGRQSVPVAEVELELLDGKPRALFELAAALRRRLPLRLGASDKAIRGYRLLGGVPPGAVRAAKLDSGGASTVEALLAQSLRGCVSHAVANESAAIDGSDIEGIHQLRVALRRLRSALSVFRPAVPEQSRQRWAAEARWLLGKLGPCRDLDVFVVELLDPLRRHPQLGGLLTELETVAQVRRKVAQVAAAAAIRSRRAGDLLLELACWVETAGWRNGATALQLELQQSPPRILAERLLARRAKRVRKTGRGFASLPAEQRHDVRIALKKLRYGLEFFAPVFGSAESRRYHQVVTALQDNLGRHNDIEVARRMVDDLVLAAPVERRVAAARGGGMLVGWYAQAAAALEPETVELWQKLRALEPFWKDEP